MLNPVTNCATLFSMQQDCKREALTQEAFARACDTPIDYVTCCTLAAQITIGKDAPLVTR
jgi:hypothetical protein